MRFRGTIILGLIFGGLVWALWFTEQDGPNVEDGAMTSVLGGRHLLAAQRIVIRSGDQVIEVERDGNQFRITEPIRDLAVKLGLLR